LSIAICDKRAACASVLAIAVPRYSSCLFQRKFEFLAGAVTLAEWKFLKRFPARFAGNFAKLCWTPASQNNGLRPIATSAAVRLT
jgi:hypothetical protein